MKCPHCMVAFHENERQTPIDTDVDGGWVIGHQTCPSCEKLVVYLAGGEPLFDEFRIFRGVRPVREVHMVRPKASTRPPCPPEVPEDLAEDYRESCLVLADSAKASAALSRRCLQHLLREYAEITPNNLASEIQELLDGGKLPSHLAETIDAVRNIGNFSAHPMKSTNSGEILPVEPAEAEWNLDVLEALFDFYFVAPEKLRQKRVALDEKLKEAGKPPMK